MMRSVLALLLLSLSQAYAFTLKSIEATNYPTEWRVHTSAGYGTLVLDRSDNGNLYFKLGQIHRTLQGNRLGLDEWRLLPTRVSTAISSTPVYRLPDDVLYLKTYGNRRYWRGGSNKEDRGALTLFVPAKDKRIWHAKVRGQAGTTVFKPNADLSKWQIHGAGLTGDEQLICLMAALVTTIKYRLSSNDEPGMAIPTE